jgi:hypothetical protein
MDLPIPVSLLFMPDQVLVRGFRYISGLPDITNDDYNKKTSKSSRSTMARILALSVLYGQTYLFEQISTLVFAQTTGVRKDLDGS